MSRQFARRPTGSAKEKIGARSCLLLEAGAFQPPTDRAASPGRQIRRLRKLRQRPAIACRSAARRPGRRRRRPLGRSVARSRSWPHGRTDGQTDAAGLRLPGVGVMRSQQGSGVRSLMSRQFARRRPSASRVKTHESTGSGLGAPGKAVKCGARLRIVPAAIVLRGAGEIPSPTERAAANRPAASAAGADGTGRLDFAARPAPILD